MTLALRAFIAVLSAISAAVATTLFIYVVLAVAPGRESSFPTLSEWLLGVLRGELGASSQYEVGAPVAELLWRGLAETLWLVSFALLFSILGSALLILLWRGSRRVSATARVAAYVVSACPSFVLAYWMSSGLNRAVWPMIQGGWIGRPAWFPVPKDEGNLPVILAALALALGSGMLLEGSRGLASEVERVLSSDFVLFARANGRRLLLHLIPNLLGPLASWLINRITALSAGALIVETIFVVPGLGRLTWQAALARDSRVLLGATLVWALLFALGRLLAQGFAVLADPRRRGRAVEA